MSISCVKSRTVRNLSFCSEHDIYFLFSPRGGDTKEFRTIQAREWAPLAATEDMFVNNMETSSKGKAYLACYQWYTDRQLERETYG